MNDKIVITGFGLVSSLGLNTQETWEALLSGKHGIRPIGDAHVRGFPCEAAALVHGLDPEGLGIHPRDARIMDKHSLMLMKASKDAFKHAHLDSSSITPDEVGFFAGMGMVDYSIEDLLPAVMKSMYPQGNPDYGAFYSGGYQDIYPLWPLSMLNNISFCQAAINLGIKGENTVFSPHADSGAQAVIEGMNTIAEHKAMAVLAGGVSEKVSPLSLARATWFGILNGEDTLCRPFGAGRTGTVLGEGSGMIILEHQSSAKKRHAPYYAAITGYGCAFDKNDAARCPTASAESRSMEQALAKAGIEPFDIDVIIAHGDGTHMGDKNEIEAIHYTFNTCLDKIHVYSSKGSLGHLLAGAPAVDVILTIHMLQHGIIPMIPGTYPVDPGLRFNLVNSKPVKASVKRVLINATSYEGQCVSLIIEKAD